MNTSLSGMKTSPKDFFLHLGVFVSLYVSAIALLVVLFQIINSIFPDELAYRGGVSLEALRSAVSALVVAVPLFLFLSRTLYRLLAAHKERAEFWMWKWLVYFTLFIAGVTFAVNVIVLVNTFLGGEVTARFLLKILAVSSLAAGVFKYYLFDLRRNVAQTAVRVRMFGRFVAVGALAVIIAGVVVAGTPAQERARRADEERVADLTNIQWRIADHYTRMRTLPTSLVDLPGEHPVDPLTKEAYEYRSTGATSFELCATFVTDYAPDEYMRESYPAYAHEDVTIVETGWTHSEGRQCFARTLQIGTASAGAGKPVPLPIR